MKIDSMMISLIALAVSVISLLLSIYRARIDRSLQWEQLRGSLQTRLTMRCIDLLALIARLRSHDDLNQIRLIEKLIRILEELVELRRMFKGLKYPSVGTSSLLTAAAKTKSDLDDADPVFDLLQSAVSNNDFVKADGAADGLIERILGTKIVPTL